MNKVYEYSLPEWDVHSSGEYLSQNKAFDAAEEHFAEICDEQYSPMLNGEEFNTAYQIWEDTRDEDCEVLETVEVKKGSIYFEYDHGDLADHGTWQRGI